MKLVQSSDLNEFVEAKIRSGEYASAEKVIEGALARWKADEEVDPTELKRLVAEGQIEADRGELLEAEDVFREISAMSAKRRGKSN